VDIWPNTRNAHDDPTVRRDVEASSGVVAELNAGQQRSVDADAT